MSVTGTTSLPRPAAQAAAARAAAGDVDSQARAGAAPPPATVPVMVLGGSGYVAGEALRLLAGHPRLTVAGVLSESQGGQPVGEAFPHLAACYPDVRFTAAGDLARLLDAAAAQAAAADAYQSALAAGCRSAGAPARAAKPVVSAICAAPHGAAAALVDRLLEAAERAGVCVRVVDLSADFRFATAGEYEQVYGHPHGAPGRLAEFGCALPEHAGLAFGGATRSVFGSAATGPAFDGTVAGAAAGGAAGLASGDLAVGPAVGAPAAGPVLPAHIGHPGCFPTSVLLATVPLVRLGWIEPTVHVVAVTGSTGAGRTPTATTHHPARRSNLFAYSPLTHRHEPEMRALAAAACGQPVAIHFVPQAGPFARGIYATLQARLQRPAADSAGGGSPAAAARATAAEITAALAEFYAGSPFVDVLNDPPRLQDVVGTNRCRIAVAVAGDRLVAFSAIDNLTKGAAGGGIQWLNRLLGFPEATGLHQPGIGWL